MQKERRREKSNQRSLLNGSLHLDTIQIKDMIQVAKNLNQFLKGSQWLCNQNWMRSWILPKESPNMS